MIAALSEVHVHWKRYLIWTTAGLMLSLQAQAHKGDSHVLQDLDRSLEAAPTAVSYTHLTLPTICSV